MKCWVCKRQARGLGHMDGRFKIADPRRYPIDWVFCSRRCQDAFHKLYGNWGDARQFGREVAMIDPSDLEIASMRMCLKAFGEAAGEIGFEKPLGAYSEAEALRVIDAIVTCYTEAMVVAHEESKFPPMRGISAPVSDPFADLIQPFQQWVAMQARMLALKLGFIQQEQAADAAASVAKVAQKSSETTAVVSMDAAKAGAGAAASQASIPYVGPALAVAAMVAMVAAVMALLGKVKKFAAGGLVSGPGTSTSDSIPARLSAGEYVLRAETVRRVGVDFLHVLNGGLFRPRWSGPRLAFAEGGLVPDVTQAPAATPSQAVRIVNVIDPGMAADYLNSAAGEKTILNVLSRNGSAVRELLR